MIKQTKSAAGKGSFPRNCFSKEFKDNYDEINWRNNKDTSVIPKGDYCYTWVEEPSEDYKFGGKVKMCPYYKTKEIDGVEIPWCDFLEMGGTPGDGQWKGWENYKDAKKKLIKHFGSKKEYEEKTSLFLLFDQTKECGVNEYSEEEEKKMMEG